MWLFSFIKFLHKEDFPQFTPEEYITKAGDYIDYTNYHSPGLDANSFQCF